MKTLVLAQTHFKTMEDHVSRCAPEEGCGLLAGTGNQVQLAIPITNQLHSAVRYNMEPVELMRALFDLEARGMELLASFHSHLEGPDYPSSADIAEFAYPGTFVLIWSRINQSWVVKAFEILAERFIPVELQIKK